MWSKFYQFQRFEGGRFHSDVQRDREARRPIIESSQSIIIAPQFIIPVQEISSNYWVFELSKIGSLAPIVPVLPPTPKVREMPASSLVVFSRRVQLRVSFFLRINST